MHKENKNLKYHSLAHFVSCEREKIGLSQQGLAKKCNLDIEQISSIESGIETFLSTTVRQKLSKGLKTSLEEIKRYEKNEDFHFSNNYDIEKIKEEILLNQGNSKAAFFCPICGSKLIVRIAKMYDLEDNLVLHHKARCSKCPFQVQ